MDREQREAFRLFETRQHSQDHSTNDEYLFVLGTSQCTVPVCIYDAEIPVIIDSGASVYFPTENRFHCLPFGSHEPIAIRGVFDTCVYSRSTGLSTDARFTVVDHENAGWRLCKTRQLH